MTTIATMMGLLACGGGDADPIPEPETDDFDLSDEDEQAIEDAAEDGVASGSYSYDPAAGTLTLTIEASSFDCGPIEGVLVATVTNLSGTEMTWEFDDGGGVTWQRLDRGPIGLVGVWKTDEPELFLILEADGTLSLVGNLECDDDRPRNDQQCVELGLFGASIAIDGDLADWDAIGASATVDDDRADHAGDDPGADIAAMKVEVEQDGLYVLMQLTGAPSEQFQGMGGAQGGVYRLHVEDDSGNSLVERLFYDANQAAWITAGDAPGVTVAMGDSGAEWRVDLAQLGSGQVSIIRVEAVDCGQAGLPCQTLDEIDDCGFVDLP